MYNICVILVSDSEPQHRRVHPHAIAEHRYPAHGHGHGHGPSFNTFNNNENKPNPLPPIFHPPHHNNNNNYNEKHPLNNIHGGSGSGANSNYHQGPASKTDYGQDDRQNHYQHSSRPGPILAEESSYGHRPSSSSSLTEPTPSTPILHQTNPHPTNLNQHEHQHFLKNEHKVSEPQPGTNEFALCKKLCGEGSVCRVLMGRPICGCPEGHTGDPAVKCYIEQNTKYDPNACQRHTDCSSALVCHKSQCTDPCLLKTTDLPNISSFHYSLDAAGNNGSVCGVNAICTVIEHNLLCSCQDDYFGNPYIGCVL